MCEEKSGPQDLGEGVGEVPSKGDLAHRVLPFPFSFLDSFNSLPCYRHSVLGSRRLFLFSPLLSPKGESVLGMGHRNTLAIIIIIFRCIVFSISLLLPSHRPQKYSEEVTSVVPLRKVRLGTRLSIEVRGGSITIYFLY